MAVNALMDFAENKINVRERVKDEIDLCHAQPSLEKCCPAGYRNKYRDPFLVNVQ